VSGVVRHAGVLTERRATTSQVPVPARPAGSAPTVIEPVPRGSTAWTVNSAATVNALRPAIRSTVDASEQWCVWNELVDRFSEIFDNPIHTADVDATELSS